MLLDQLSYIQFRGEPSSWELGEFTLGQINLIVGRNSTGKSRLLSVIGSLGNRFLAGSQDYFHQGEYRVVFHSKGNSWDYTFEFDAAEIVSEKLLHNGEDVLSRGKGGIGQIVTYTAEENSVRLKFRAPAKLLSVVSKRDSLQHPYLEPLHEWANDLRYFRFGDEMSSSKLAFRVTGDQVKLPEPSDKDTDQLTPIFDRAAKLHGKKLINIIIDDMEKLGYPISELAIRRPANVMFRGFLPGEAVGVSVKEQELAAMTDQTDMSQGMFRSLSLLIQATHYMLSDKTGCILIDDVGEGLDFERSCVLIDLIREKAKKSAFQLIMATNNRFVMNRVPLEEWCYLQRTAGKVRVRNYSNSKAAFDSFKKTGLNNFDLLATDYLKDS